MFYKTVLRPMLVPNGDYCWSHMHICPYFDNEGGHPRCMQDFGPLEYDRNSHVRKPKECKELKTPDEY